MQILKINMENALSTKNQILKSYVHNVNLTTFLNLKYLNWIF